MYKIFYAYVKGGLNNERHTDFNSLYYENIQKELEGLKNYKVFNYIIDGGFLNDPQLNEAKVLNDSTESIKVLNNLQSSDIVIFEMSFPSQTMGFLLSYALQKGKPALYLYSKVSGKPSVPVVGNPSRLLSIQQYDDKNLKKSLDKFMKKAERQLRSDRITFVSSREINDYVNWKSVQNGLSKGEVIRAILEEKIYADTDYISKVCKEESEDIKK